MRSPAESAPASLPDGDLPSRDFLGDDVFETEPLRSERAGDGEGDGDGDEDLEPDC